MGRVSPAAVLAESCPVSIGSAAAVYKGSCPVRDGLQAVLLVAIIRRSDSTGVASHPSVDHAPHRGGRRRLGLAPSICCTSSRIRGRVVALPAMGKFAHEPGKTAATRANVRCLRRWPREILPVRASATPAHFAVLRTKHEEDRLKAVTQAVLPAQGSTPIPLEQGLRYTLLCFEEARR